MTALRVIGEPVPPACMGGWACTLRNQCARHLQFDRRAPVERLCEPGRTSAFVPVVQQRAEVAA